MADFSFAMGSRGGRAGYQNWLAEQGNGATMRNGDPFDASDRALFGNSDTLRENAQRIRAMEDRNARDVANSRAALEDAKDDVAFAMMAQDVPNAVERSNLQTEILRQRLEQDRTKTASDVAAFEEAQWARRQNRAMRDRLDTFEKSRKFAVLEDLYENQVASPESLMALNEMRAQAGLPGLADMRMSENGFIVQTDETGQKSIWNDVGSLLSYARLRPEAAPFVEAQLPEAARVQLRLDAQQAKEEARLAQSAQKEQRAEADANRRSQISALQSILAETNDDLKELRLAALEGREEEDGSSRLAELSQRRKEIITAIADLSGASALFGKAQQAETGTTQNARVGLLTNAVNDSVKANPL